MPCNKKNEFGANYFICESYSPTVYAIMLICRLGDFSYLGGYGLFKVIAMISSSVGRKVKKKNSYFNGQP